MQCINKKNVDVGWRLSQTNLLFFLQMSFMIEVSREQKSSWLTLISIMFISYFYLYRFCWVMLELLLERKENETECLGWCKCFNILHILCSTNYQHNKLNPSPNKLVYSFLLTDSSWRHSEVFEFLNNGESHHERDIIEEKTETAAIGLL